MKALFKLFRRFDARRIFGFIRRLGGMSRPKVKCYDLRSTHALRVEGDGSRFYRPAPYRNFYPRPPGGGRLLQAGFTESNLQFLSTPSGWRATRSHWTDTLRSVPFLSTPSGWRATLSLQHPILRLAFLSTPSGWRATGERHAGYNITPDISIHALRVEGDGAVHFHGLCNSISIHALRVEGDLVYEGLYACRLNFYPRPPSGGRRFTITDIFGDCVGISIHALRVEGDAANPVCCYSVKAIFLSTPSGWRATVIGRGHNPKIKHFYPRPPGGGRRCREYGIYVSGEFLSTPSGWRATSGCPILSRKAPNFYPRPPGGGRLDLREPAAAPKIFLSTPSGWRATSTNKSKIFLSKISIHALRVEGDT